MSWDHALDEMVALRRAYSTDVYQRFTVEFLRSLFGEANAPASIATVAEGFPNLLDASDPIWVSDEVVELVEVAAESFRPEPIFLDDLFVPQGFALLERPMQLTDAQGKRVTWRAVQWGQFTTGSVRAEHADGSSEPMSDGLLVMLYAHRDDPDDYDVSEFPLLGGSALTLGHIFPIEFGRDHSVSRSGNPADPRYLRQLGQVQTLWRLAQQEIARPRQERASRPSWRRAASWRQIKHVTVLTLRRTRPASYEGERDVEWSHRWIVRGHWRSQPYKINGEVVHRQIWIEPFVKGPADRPLVVKQHAIEFTR